MWFGFIVSDLCMHAASSDLTVVYSGTSVSGSFWRVQRFSGLALIPIPITFWLISVRRILCSQLSKLILWIDNRHRPIAHSGAAGCLSRQEIGVWQDGYRRPEAHPAFDGDECGDFPCRDPESRLRMFHRILNISIADMQHFVVLYDDGYRLPVSRIARFAMCSTTLMVFFSQLTTPILHLPYIYDHSSSYSPRSS